MQNFVPGAPVTLTIALNMESGEAIAEPTLIRWRLVDEAEVELQAWETVPQPLPVQGEFSVTVPSLLNTLAPGATRALRTVEAEITTPQGVVPVSQSYLIAASSALALGNNSWMTYGQALLISEMIPGLTSWMASRRDFREYALMIAFARLGRMAIYAGSSGTSGTYATGWLHEMPPEVFAQTDPRFQDAVRRAQLIEADYILSDDQIRGYREAGVVSMTVGETSSFFRNVKPMKLGLCQDAFEAIRPWTSSRVVVRR